LNGKDNTSDYKKRLFMRKTLGWYYWLPSFVRPRPKLSAVVAAVDNDEDVPAGATKKRNKMLLCEMAAQGNWDQVQALIDLVGLNINEADAEGEVALIAAASNGHANLVTKLFRDYRANLLEKRADDGYTALIAAAEAREIGSVRALLKCAEVLPVRLAHDHLKGRDQGLGLDARAHAVKNGSNAIVTALDDAEAQILARPATCRHGCGLSVSYGGQEAHENRECPVYTCACSNGCGLRVRRAFIEVHQGYECPRRLRVPSPR
jgi:hypothetical protein